jgi:hypothetical protein
MKNPPPDAGRKAVRLYPNPLVAVIECFVAAVHNGPKGFSPVGTSVRSKACGQKIWFVACRFAREV